MPHLNSRLCALLAMGLSLAAVPGLDAQDASSAAAPAPAAIRGDVNGDGRVTRADADAVRAWLVRGTLPDGRAILPAGDANGDGRVTAADAALISRFAAGVDVSRFPVGRAVEAVQSGTLQTGDQFCTVDVKAGTLSCQEVLAGGAAAANVILGTPYVTFVTTTAHSRGSSADEDTTSYTVAIRNATSQPLGTTDGTTVAPDGIRLFFSSAPAVQTVSSGATFSIRLETPDGTATFTNQNGSATYANRMYFQYDTVVAPGDTTDARSMQFIYSPNVLTFSFGYRVSAPAQYEHGRIAIAPATLTLAPAQTATLTGTVYNQVDVVQADGITWSSSDPSVATVNASTGEVTAVAVGTATITATSTVNAQRTGTRDVVVTFETTWQGDDVGDPNNWHNPLNWSGGAVPNAQSIAIIPAVTNQPVLSADGVTLDLQVASGATVTLDGRTLQAYGDVTATGTIARTTSGGTLWLSGTGAEVQGTLPAVQITGSTSLDGATIAKAAVSVNTGSLTVADQALNISIP